MVVGIKLNKQGKGCMYRLTPPVYHKVAGVDLES